MSEKVILYECDPEKNQECRKHGCYIHAGRCHKTTKPECAKKNENGEPIVSRRIVRERGWD